MNDATPSPAGTRRQAEPLRNGMGKPPWDQALLAQVRALEARVEQIELERTQAVLAVQQLRAKLAESRRRLENWELRRQAWGAERAELLAKLGQAASPPGKE